MKLTAIVASILILSCEVFSTEVIVDENRAPFAFSNVVFSLGVSDGKKPIKRQGYVHRQVKKVITDYYPVLKVQEVSVDSEVDVKRRRIESQPLSEIDTNIVSNESEGSELEVRTRGRSGAVGSFEDLELLMIGLSFGK